MTFDLRDTPVLREARLRPEAGDRYPWAPRNSWLPASAMADEALKNDEPTARAARALPNEAFEFRGARPEAPVRSRARTRWSDYPNPMGGARRH